MTRWRSFDNFDKAVTEEMEALLERVKKGTGADKSTETLSGKQLFPRSLKLTFKQREGLIIGVTMIRGRIDRTQGTDRQESFW